MDGDEEGRPEDWAWGREDPYPSQQPYLGGAEPLAVPVRRRRVALVAAAGVLIAAIALAVGLSVGSGTGGSKHLATVGDSFVAAAAQHTLAQKTAEVEVSGNVSVGGTTVPMGGHGLVDFTDNQMSLALNVGFSGHSLDINELFGGRTLYMAMTVDGRDMASLTGGYHWVGIPIATSGTNLQNNPASALAVLEHQGAAVTQLGTRTIDGSSCRGFQVIPDRQAMVAAAQKEFSAMGLTPAESQVAMDHLRNMSSPQIDVWFDGQGLTRQMDMDMQFGAMPSVGQASTNVTMTFTRFGVPVHITTPDPADAMSYSQFLKVVGGQG